MAPAPGVQVSLRILVRGFDEAHARLQDALAMISSTPEDVFLPLFEALHWAVAVWYLAKRKHETIKAPGDDLLALRYARNRAGHQWANALEVREVLLPRRPMGGGRRGPYSGSFSRTTPVSVRAWLWLPEAQLPPADPKFSDSKGKTAYMDRLEEQPAHEVLQRFSDGLIELR